MSSAGPGDLPQELLQRVLHDGGRATRRVCRHWHATYAPLRCGLLLTDPTSSNDLPANLSCISALALATSSLPPPPSPARPPDPTSIPPALPHSFPRLASFDLDATLLPCTLPTPDLHPLAPLHPHLTALTLRHIDLRAQPLAALAAALPTLRSLTLTLGEHTLASLFFDNTPAIVSTLTALHALSHLHHLALRHAPSTRVPCLSPAVIVPPLAALAPTLTHLDFRLCRLAPNHTPQDLHPLHAALPALRTLHLALHLVHHPTLDSSVDTLAAALSQRQALTSLHLDLTVGFSPPSDSAVGRLARLRSLRSLCLRLGPPFHAVDAASVLARLGPPLAAATALTSLTVDTSGTGLATLQQVEPLAALAPALLHLDWARGGSATYAMVAALAGLTALQSLDLPPCFQEFYSWQSEGATMWQAAEAVMSLTRLTRLAACSSTKFASRLLGGIGRLPALRQLVVSPADDAQAMSGLATASSTLTRVELHCGVSSSAACILRAAGAMPPSVRCLALRGVSEGTGPALAQQIQQEELEGGLGLLPLPRGLRVLALGGDTLQALSGQVPVALEAAARRQDCVVVAELPREERHFGCNGYL